MVYEGDGDGYDCNNKNNNELGEQTMFIHKKKLDWGKSLVILDFFRGSTIRKNRAPIPWNIFLLLTNNTKT